VPTVDNNVIIPASCTYYPIISEITGKGLSINNTDNTYCCKSLTIESGASVTLKNNVDWTYPNLSCSGILTINGKFTHSYHASKINMCFLNSGSNVTVNSTGVFNVGNMGNSPDRYNTLVLNDGAKLNINGGTVSIMNEFIHKGELNITSGTLYIKRYGSGNNPAQTDGGPSWDSYATAKLNIQDGDVYICGNQSGKRMIDWNAAKTVNWTGGTLHLTLKEHTSGADNSTNLKFSGHSIYNLTIDRSGMTNTIEELTGNDLIVKGNLTITNGTLATATKNISVAGNWTNNGTFTAGTGSVFFSGANKTIGGTKTSTFYNLTLLDGSSYTINPTTDRAEVTNTFITENNSTLNLAAGKKLSLLSSTNTINGNITTASTKYDEATLQNTGNFEIFIRRDNTLSGSGTIAADVLIFKDAGNSSITNLGSDITIDGSLWISNEWGNEAKLVLGTHKMTVAGNWISNGIFDSGTGTVVLNPTENRTIRTFTPISVGGTVANDNNFYNLKVQAASGKTVKLLRDGTGIEDQTNNPYAGHLRVKNNLEVLSGIFSTGGPDVAGRKFISQNVTLVETGATLNIGGLTGSETSWGKYVSEFHGDIILRGNITTTRTVGDGYAEMFLLGARLKGSGNIDEFGCDIQIHNAATTTQVSDSYIKGSLIIAATGTLICESNKILTVGGDFYVYNNLTHKGTVNVYGNMTNGSYTTGVVNLNSSVFNFIQSGSKFTKLDKKIGFGEVNIKGGGTRVFQQDIDCASDLTIDAGSTMDMYTTSPKNISLSQSANFVNNGTFVPYTNTVSFIGNVAQNITGSTQTKFYILEINKTGSGVYPQNIAQVSNQLMLTNGIFYTSTSKYISLLDQSSVSPAGGKATSFVNGPVFKTGRDGISGNYSFVFPTGKNGIWARIASIHHGGTTANTDQFMAEYFDFPYPVLDYDISIQAVSTVEYWNLSKLTGNTDLQKKVKLYSDDKDRSGITSFTDDADLTVAHFNTTTQKWEDVGLTGSFESGSTGWILSDFNNDFSPFTFASKLGNNPLPVTLLSFDAEFKNKVVETSWSTATEFNTDRFVVQKSKDLVHFTDVGSIQASGFSNQTLNYSLIDDAPWDNISYYRLKTVDFDNSFAYSQIVSVNSSLDSENGKTAQQNSFELLSLYPNPVVDEFYVMVNALENTKLTLSITDVNGKLIYQKHLSILESENKIWLNASSFVDGFYILTLHNERYKESKKFVKWPNGF
ncbi:MAG: T9SS type A sorting domain-containing protein, partial [Bacteroidales bacterium]|nr:T9SS type A sorting domain-containing protein [Bacteroidales bacterium]